MMSLCRGLAGLLLVSLLSQVHSRRVVEEIEEKVFLNCNGEITQFEGTEGTWMFHNKTMNLGRRILDPRGIYRCNYTDDKKVIEISFVQVYYRMCQSCVELDTATLAGILVIDVIATLLLALGVHCFAGHETGRLPGALPVDDTQALLRNNQLYQPLRHQNDDPYSHLGENWHRNKRA